MFASLFYTDVEQLFFKPRPSEYLRKKMLIHGNRTAENFSRKSYDSEKAKQVKELFMDKLKLNMKQLLGKHSTLFICFVCLRLDDFRR